MSVVLVAESAADVGNCITFAQPLRKAGITVITPVSYTKPRKQIERAKADPKALRMVVLDGDKASIVDIGTNCRIETSRSDAIEAMLDTYADLEDFTNETARKLGQMCLDAS